MMSWQRHAVHARSSVVLQHQPPSRRQHVEPIDPVVQGVEPEPRFLLGLVAQLPSQFRDFSGSVTARLHLRRGRRSVGSSTVAVFRSGTLSKRVSLP